MTKEDLRIVYMGTPDFAVESLRALVEGGYHVVAVVTMPDKPVGRHGSVLQPSPVKQYAVEHGLKVMQPEKLKDPAFVEELRSLKADLQIVVAFRMLPEIVWSMPPLGTFNAHASLLPKYRGAAPINWAVINGETETGITTFFLKHEIDTGDIIQQVHIPIEETDNVEVIHDKLMVLGADLVEQTVEAIIEGSVEFRVQRSFIQGAEVLKGAPKITKEMCRIDWNKPSVQVCNFVRGMSPYPTAWTEISKEGENPLTMKVFFAERLSTEDYERLKAGRTVVPGQILSDGKGILAVATADGAVALTDLQMAGKKRMDAKSFLLGFREPENYTVE